MIFKKIKPFIVTHSHATLNSYFWIFWQFWKLDKLKIWIIMNILIILKFWKIWKIRNIRIIWKIFKWKNGKKRKKKTLSFNKDWSKRDRIKKGKIVFIKIFKYKQYLLRTQNAKRFCSFFVLCTTFGHIYPKLINFLGIGTRKLFLIIIIIS